MKAVEVTIGGEYMTRCRCGSLCRVRVTSEVPPAPKTRRFFNVALLIGGEPAGRLRRSAAALRACPAPTH